MGSGYRDESETLRARIETLETELDTAKQTIARLKGDAIVDTRAATPSDELTKPTWILDAPPRLVVRRDLPFEASDKALVAISKLLPARLGQRGQVTSVGRALTFRVGTLEFALTPTPSGTHLQLVVDSRGALVLPFVIGLASMFTVVPFAGTALGTSPLLLVAMLAAAALGTVIGRALIGRSIRAYQARCRGTVEAITTIIEKNVVRKARIAAEPGPLTEERDDEERTASEARR